MAADPKVQFVGEGALGYTDNIQSSPSEPVPGIAPKEAGAFAILRPGAVLALTTPRIMHRLSYSFTYNLFFVASQTNNTANRLEYLGFYDLSPFTTLLLGGGLTESNPDTATTLGGTALLPGSTAFVAGTGDALLTHELAPEWRTWLGASALAQAPLFDTVAPRTTEVGARTGIERAWQEDALGLEARGTYTVITDGFLADGRQPRDHSAPLNWYMAKEANLYQGGIPG